MNKILDFLNGKKAYITAGLILVLTVLVIAFHVTIPDWVWVVLGSVGLGFVKAAIPTGDVQLTGFAQKVFATKYGKYIVSVFMGLFAAAMSLGIVIPEFIWTALAGLGFISMRANVEVSKNAPPPLKLDTEIK